MNIKKIYVSFKSSSFGRGCVYCQWKEINQHFEAIVKQYVYKTLKDNSGLMKKEYVLLNEISSTY